MICFSDKDLCEVSESENHSNDHGVIIETRLSNKNCSNKCSGNYDHGYTSVSFEIVRASKQ